MYNLAYLVTVSIIFYTFHSSQGMTCTRENKIFGEIYDSQNTNMVVSKCWSIEVPESSYIKLNVKQLNFNSYPCNDLYVKIFVTGTQENYTYCHQDSYRKPITALSDVNVTYYHNGANMWNRGRSSSFRLEYSIESLICAQNNHFRCSPSKCIHQYQVCNGKKDCENGKDEVGCEKGITVVKGLNVSLENAATWMRSQRSASFGWGKNTHRAITALYLAKAHDFSGNNLEEEVMVKQLELQTSVALLRNATNPISVSELSMFINALTVTCHNPRKFFGFDLLQILRQRLISAHSPSPSAYLTLCTSNWTFSESDIKHLLKPLHAHSKYPFLSDVQAVTVMALTCVKNKTNSFASASSTYNKTIKKFVASQHPDGSFGNVYTTALVTQALIASGQENNKEWNVTATAHYLMKELNSSSIDFLSAYLALPIFAGRSLIDISEVNCFNSTRKQEEDNDISDVTDKLGGKMQIRYSLYVGDQKDVIHTIILRLPENSTAYDVMRVAQVADPKYKFLHRHVSGQMYIYEIAGIINDPEAETFWLLYTEENHKSGALKHHKTSPEEYIMAEDEHLIMWYKTANIY